MAGDHADVRYIQCKGYTPGRRFGNPLWIVFHDMEAHELPDTAESTAAYGANPTDGRSVSWHYAADVDSVIQCVRLADTAWTVGNIGNDLGINWEFAGFASQTRAQWLDMYGVDMFAKAIPIMVRDMRTYGIPARWLTDAQVAAKQKGLTTHNQLRRVFGGTTHTDPGPNFPADYVLALIQSELDGEDMTPEQAVKLTAEVHEMHEVMIYNIRGWLKDHIDATLKYMAIPPPTSGEVAAKLAGDSAFVGALAKAIVKEFAA